MSNYVLDHEGRLRRAIRCPYCSGTGTYVVRCHICVGLGFLYGTRRRVWLWGEIVYVILFILVLLGAIR